MSLLDSACRIGHRKYLLKMNSSENYEYTRHSSDSDLPSVGGPEGPSPPASPPWRSMDARTFRRRDLRRRKRAGPWLLRFAREKSLDPSRTLKFRQARDPRTVVVVLREILRIPGFGHGDRGSRESPRIPASAGILRIV